ncbi:hypothetical protein ACFL6U_28430 [Planctomycetota bacterium]
MLDNFSGYIAADELYEVLDHDPTGDDMRRFFGRFKQHLDHRGLTVIGITTDGSPLYPVPIVDVFGSDVEHQLCEFHVLQEITKAVLKAVIQVRKKLKTRKVKCGRGCACQPLMGPLRNS